MEEDLEGFKSQIKLSTLPRKLVKIHCQPRQTWSEEESLLRIVVMSSRCIMKMLFTPYSFAQPCNLYGDFRQIGTIARFRRAPLSLTFLNSFLQVTETPISLLLCCGQYGIGGIICVWASQQSHLAKWLLLLKTKSWRQALAMLVFSDPDNSLEGTDPACL